MSIILDHVSYQYQDAIQKGEYALKDINLKEEYTFQLEECACGKGTLDIGLYARLATAENPRMPMIIEHLSTDEEYIESVKYVRENIAV